MSEQMEYDSMVVDEVLSRTEEEATMTVLDSKTGKEYKCYLKELALNDFFMKYGIHHHSIVCNTAKQWFEENKDRLKNRINRQIQNSSLLFCTLLCLKYAVNIEIVGKWKGVLNVSFQPKH